MRESHSVSKGGQKGVNKEELSDQRPHLDLDFDCLFGGGDTDAPDEPPSPTSHRPSPRPRRPSRYEPPVASPPADGLGLPGTPERMLADYRRAHPLDPVEMAYSSRSQVPKRNAALIREGLIAKTKLDRLRPVARQGDLRFYAGSEQDGPRAARLVNEMAHLQRLDEGLTWEVHPETPYAAILVARGPYIVAVVVARRGGVAEAYRWGEPIPDPEPEHDLVQIDNAPTVFALWAAKSARSPQVKEAMLRTLAQDLGIEASKLAFTVEVAAHHAALVRTVSPEVLRLRG